MTLSRQLILLISVLTLLLFVGTFAISVNSTQKYLQVQLGSHAQDTATSLGLAASTALLEGDGAKVQSMANALFDSGYYQLIEVVNAKNEQVVSLVSEPTVASVPLWFSQAFQLDPPKKEALIVNGWMQAGKSYVKSHPGYAYAQLWKSTQQMLLWFSTAAIVALGLGLFLLRWLLNPLSAVEAQALAICNRRFIQLKEIPRTRELRQIVVAMNRMTAKVKQMLTDADNLATDLRSQAYQHAVTGLPNRQYFVSSAHEILGNDEARTNGVLVLIQLSNFKQINDEIGYMEGDELLSAVADVLRTAVADDNQLLVHMNGGDFALLMPGSDTDQAKGYALSMHKNLPDIEGVKSIDGRPYRIGIAAYQPHDDLNMILSRADTALRVADSSVDAIGIIKETHSVDKPASYWRTLLNEVLVNKHMSIALQPVKTVDQKEIIHHEALLRLTIPEKETGELNIITAGEFIVVAQRFGLIEKLDEAMVFLAIDYIKENNIPVAINLAPETISNEDSCRLILQKIGQLGSKSALLSVEVSELTAIKWPEELAEFSDKCHQVEVKLGVDHVGRSFGSLRYLHAIQPDYLKIDGAFIRGIDENTDNRFYVHALRDIAHSLEAIVIAESVENDAVMRVLDELNIDGVQGYYIGRPELN